MGSIQFMKKIISGIYKITNTITGEFYIGSSSNIYQRWSSHKIRYKEKNSREYNKKLYCSMREYGINNFKFEIIEQCDYDLFRKEQEYINKLDAYNKGLNENIVGENHGKTKLTNEDIIDIRERYSNHESKRSVYEDYKYLINKCGFHKIWNGYTWKHIKMDVYTSENKEFYKNNTGSDGELNPRSKLTEDEVRYIRNCKKEGKIKKEIYNLFSDKLTLGSFNCIWYGYNWKNIIV